MSFFFFSVFYRTGPVWGCLYTCEQRRIWRKECGMVNMVQILAHMYVNGKMRPVEIIPEWRSRG
jgi:hypothetical protein